MEDILPVEIKVQPETKSLATVDSSYVPFASSDNNTVNASTSCVSQSDPLLSSASIDQVVFQNAVIADIKENDIPVKSLSLAGLLCTIVADVQHCISCTILADT